MAGTYEVTIQTEPPVKLKFAAQADPRESRLDALTEGQLTQLGSVATVVHWQPELAWKQSGPANTGSWDIWRVLAWIALVVAVTETVLGQIFSEPK